MIRRETKATKIKGKKRTEEEVWRTECCIKTKKNKRQEGEGRDKRTSKERWTT